MEEILSVIPLKRIRFPERLGLRIYCIPKADQQFLKIRRSFDQVNQLVKDLPCCLAAEQFYNSSAKNASISSQTSFWKK